MVNGGGVARMKGPPRVCRLLFLHLLCDGGVYTELIY